MTLTTFDELCALAEEWDGLVRAMPRPSPFMLHGWLTEWWRHYGDGRRLGVIVAFADGRLVGALPLCLESRFGLRIRRFIGGTESALGDVLLAPGADEAVARALTTRLIAGRHDLVDLVGLPGDSRLAANLGPSKLLTLERLESPVMDLSAGWEATYRAKTSSKRRNLHGRRRRQLSRLGQLGVRVARTEDELSAALEDAFRLHDMRWRGRPDRSDFTSERGSRFHRAAIRTLASHDVPRIVTLTLDGRAIAFNYYFRLCGRMYLHRLAFDPDLARYSPGVANTLDVLQIAADEGATLVEFLGGAERYKRELADRFEPLYHGLGIAGTPQGRLVAVARARSIELRKRLKRSEALRRFYFEGMAPLRRRMRGGAPPSRPDCRDAAED
jgi:CelD/BcsL family acetyltransferase involved in cellulose biosynthesis